MVIIIVSITSITMLHFLNARFNAKCLKNELSKLSLLKLYIFLTGRISCSGKARERRRHAWTKTERKKFPQSLQRCAKRKADLNIALVFSVFDLHSIALKLHWTRRSVKWMWRKLGTRGKFYFVWKRAMTRKTILKWKVCQLKATRYKVSRESKKESLFVIFIFFSLNFVKIFFARLRLRKKPDSFEEDESWLVIEEQLFWHKNRKEVAVSVRRRPIGE